MDARTSFLLGRIQLARGNVTEASKALQKAPQTRLAAFDETHPDTGAAYYKLGQIAELSQDYEQAL